MAYTYLYLRASVEESFTVPEIADALEAACAHLSSGKAMPVSIANEDRSFAIDLPAILDVWRKQPEMQMALLAEGYAMESANAKQDYENRLQKLSETFRRELDKLSRERDHRRTAYPSVSQG